ncbi:MAG: hypothetical protein HOI35_08830 [Woeseia sp.]|jgi:hypothetical protein|nr:hypothetical protein [Woeseia sp.]
MDLSFQEKSILGSLAITICLFFAYFIDVFELVTTNNSTGILTLPARLMGIVLSVVAVEVVFHIVIAIFAKDEGTDERDRFIAAKAAQISYYILAVGCLTAVGHLFFATLQEAAVGVSLQSAILAANVIVFSFILAEVVGFSLQLFYYRRGV